MSSYANFHQGCHAKCTMCIWTYSHTVEQGHQRRKAEEALHFKEIGESVLCNERLALILAHEAKIESLQAQITATKELNEEKFKKFLANQMWEDVYGKFSTCLIRVPGLQAELKATSDPRRIQCLKRELMCIKRFQENMERDNREETSDMARFFDEKLARVEGEVNAEISQARIEFETSLEDIDEMLYWLRYEQYE